MIQIALIDSDHTTADYGMVSRRLRGARLAAVVEADDTLARRTSETLAVPLWASFDDLLRDHGDAFDAVVIRRVSGSPRSVVAQAVRAGKHVLLDMPLLLQMPSGDASIAACRSEGVILMLGQAARFSPSVAEVKSCLKSGVLGMPGLLRVHHWRPLKICAQTPSDPEQAGTTAAIFQAVLPDIDLANWIFESLPTEVYAAGHAEPEDTPDAHGYIQVHLGYPDGGMALVDHSMTLPQGSDYFSLSVFGSSGAAYVDDHHNMHLLYGGGRPTALPAGQGALHQLGEFQEFVDAIVAARSPAITAEDGQKAVEVARAAGRSLKTGRAMRLIGGHYESA